MKEDELKCKYCGNELFLGGKDYDLKEGCYYAYWLCKKCPVIAIEHVIYGKRVSVEWAENAEEEYLF